MLNLRWLSRFAVTVLFAILAVPCLSVAASSGSVLAGPAASRYRRWFNADPLPRPRGIVDVIQALGTSVETASPDGSQTIIMGNSTSGQSTFYHELGHAFDNTRLTDRDRIDFRAYLREPQDWGAPGAARHGEPNPPREQFAEAYRLLALHPLVTTSRSRFQHLINAQQGYTKGMGPAYTDSGYRVKRVHGAYGFAATWQQLRKIQRLIDSA